MLSNVFMARLLGPSGKGVVALALLWSFMLASVGTVGLEVGLVVFSSARPRHARHYLLQGVKYSAVAGCAGAAVLLAVARWLGVLHGASSVTRALAAGLVPVQMALLLASAVLTGAGRLPAVNRTFVAAWLVDLVLLGALLMSGRRDVDLALGAFAICQLLQLGLLLRPGLASTPAVGEPASAPAPLREIVRYSLGAYPGALAGLLHLSLSGLVLGIVASAAEVGVYSVAYALTAATYTLPIAVATVLLPSVVRADSRQALNSTALSARLTVALTFGLALIAATSAGPVIRLLFGAAFAKAAWIFILLLPSAVAFSLSKTLSAYFQGAGQPGVPSAASLVGLTAVVLLGLPLASRYGAVGAAVGMSLSMVLGSAVLLGFFTRRSHFGVRSALVPTRSDVRLLLAHVPLGRRPSSSPSEPPCEG